MLKASVGLLTGAVVCILFLFMTGFYGPSDISFRPAEPITETSVQGIEQDSEFMILTASADGAMHRFERIREEIEENGERFPETSIEEVDPEWAELPRHHERRWRFPRMVAGHRLSARDMYRHRFLNPGDVYIPPARREELAVIVTQINEGLAEVEKSLSRAKYLEFTAQREEGKAKSISREDRINQMPAQHAEEVRNYVELQNEKARERTGRPDARMNVVNPIFWGGRQPAITHTQAGETDLVWYAFMEDLPFSNHIRGQYSAAAAQAATILMAWFQKVGPGISETQVLQTIEEVMSIIERHGRYGG